MKVQSELTQSQLDTNSTVTAVSQQSSDLSNPQVVTKTFANLLRFNSKLSLSQGSQAQTVRRNPKTIVVENTNSYWNVEVYGGVKVWVNSKTGDVSVENPHQPTARRRSVHSRRSITNMTWKIAGQMDGTGGREGEHCKSPTRGSVYFNPDMKELMDLLDGQSSRKISQAVHHRH